MPLLKTYLLYAPFRPPLVGFSTFDRPGMWVWLVKMSKIPPQAGIARQSHCARSHSRFEPAAPRIMCLALFYVCGTCGLVRGLQGGQQRLEALPLGFCVERGGSSRRAVRGQARRQPQRGCRGSCGRHTSSRRDSALQIVLQIVDCTPPPPPICRRRLLHEDPLSPWPGRSSSTPLAVAGVERAPAAAGGWRARRCCS
jgi:hypothetical protein